MPRASNRARTALWLIAALVSATGSRAEDRLRQAREAKAIVDRLAPLPADSYRWKRWPHEDLSAARLADLLRPKQGKAYLDAIPRLDGWGRPLEIVGSPGNLSFGDLFAIRSAGPNGRFEGPLYARGAWSYGAAGDDLVWANGEFVRWPEGAPAADP